MCKFDNNRASLTIISPTCVAALSSESSVQLAQLRTAQISPEPLPPYEQRDSKPSQIEPSREYLVSSDQGFLHATYQKRVGGRGSAQRRHSSRPSGTGRRQSPGKSPSGRVRATDRQPPEPELLPPEPEPAATSRPPASRHSPGQSPGRRPPVASQRAAEARAAATFAEDEERRAIGRFQPFLRVKAVSATARPTSPDYFGLRRHLARAKRRASPARTPVRPRARR